MEIESSTVTGRLPRSAFVAACLVFLNGLIALAEALVLKPPGVLEWMLHWMPIEIVQHSRLLLAFAGLSLLLLSRGLFRRKRVAWRLALTLLAVVLVSHLGHAFDWHHALLTLAVGTLLAWNRREFPARSDQPSLRKAALMVPIFFIVLFLLARVGLSRFQHGAGKWTTAVQLLLFQSPEFEMVPSARAQAFFDSIQVGTILASLISLGLLLRPVVARPYSSEKDWRRAREIIARYGNDPMDEFALLGDKLHHFKGDSVVAYALWRDQAVVLASPIGPPELLPEAIRDFRAFCVRQDWRPVFSQFPAEHRIHYEQQGMCILKVAENARLDLDGFRLAGGKFQKIRTACNRARKSGLAVRWYGAGVAPNDVLEEELSAISSEWLATKHGDEMTFDLGQFSIAEIRKREVSYTVSGDGRIDAFATWLPYARGSGRCIDLMRSRRDARGVMDFLIAESLFSFRERGVREASLGSAPLANVDAAASYKLPDRAVKYLFENFNQIYGYKSLFEFKEKYDPQWRGRYLACIDPAHLPMAALAMARVHMTKGFMRFLKS
jgi:phosphatidylglycerol lysyltransferase